MKVNLGRARSVALATAALGLVVLAGPTVAADDAMVRVLHGSPDAPAVDVYIDGEKVGGPLAGLEFGEISEYVALPAGEYDLKVCAAADETVCPIEADNVSVEAGTSYTIAATNVLASIEAQIITDEPNPVAGESHIRVVHFSADTPAIDVLTQDGETAVVDGLAYPDATDYAALDPGTYDLKVCADADTSVCPLDPGPLDLAGGTAYSVFAVGSLESDPATLTAVVAADGAAAPDTATLEPFESPAPADASWVGILAAVVLVTLLALARLVTRRSEG